MSPHQRRLVFSQTSLDAGQSLSCVTASALLQGLEKSTWKNLVESTHQKTPQSAGKRRTTSKIREIHLPQMEGLSTRTAHGVPLIQPRCSTRALSPASRRVPCYHCLTSYSPFLKARLVSPPLWSQGQEHQLYYQGFKKGARIYKGDTDCETI